MKKHLLDKAYEIKRKKRSKHDKLVDSLEERLRNTLDSEGNPFYDEIIVNREFHREGKTHITAGEIDLYAQRIGINERLYTLYFEIKSYDSQKNMSKAHFQLDREVRVLNEGERVYTFYVTPKGIEWYKRRNE